jgi:hypothetical protein
MASVWDEARQIFQAQGLMQCPMAKCHDAGLAKCCAMRICNGHGWAVSGAMGLQGQSMSTPKLIAVCVRHTV